jgi:hypothetical protein
MAAFKRLAAPRRIAAVNHAAPLALVQAFLLSQCELLVGLVINRIMRFFT